MRTMYDSVDPNAIPTNATMVAGYIDGTDYRWPESTWNRFPNAVKVRIARRVTTNDGHVLDVEAGIPTVWPPSFAIVEWVQMRRRSGVEPTIYCNQLNDWPSIRTLFRNTGVREPQWWVARYNNVRDIPAGAIAKQYANPPLAGGHYDLSIVADYWPGVDRITMAIKDELSTVPKPGGGYYTWGEVFYWDNVYANENAREMGNPTDPNDRLTVFGKLNLQDLKINELLVAVRDMVATLDTHTGTGRLVARGSIELVPEEE